MTTGTHRAIETVWRIEAPRLIAGLARLVRDVGVAEELAQDALVAALEQWPAQGVPDNPGAWLMTIGKRRAIDQIRHNETFKRKVEEVGRELEESTPDIAASVVEDDGIGDDLLRLVFVACHPVLSTQARVALTLRLLGDLSTDEIARAFLVPESTVAQRIVRAKKTLAKAGVAFEVPRGEELAARLSSVLEVVYLIFNEGYSATAGGDWMRPALCADALRLGRVLARLAPREPEVHGLVALMEIQAPRVGARTGPGGEPILDEERTQLREKLESEIQHSLTDAAVDELMRESSRREINANLAAQQYAHEHWRDDLTVDEAFLIYEESKFKPTAHNPAENSTAFGLGQLTRPNREKFARRFGWDPGTTEAWQQKVMFRAYVKERYGDEHRARRFWEGKARKDPKGRGDY